MNYSLITPTQSNPHPRTLYKALLTKYFVDGLWLKDQQAVLEDIIDNINNYLSTAK